MHELQTPRYIILWYSIYVYILVKKSNKTKSTFMFLKTLNINIKYKKYFKKGLKRKVGHDGE